MRKICLFSLCLVVIFCLTATPLTALALDSTITADAVFVDTQVRFRTARMAFGKPQSMQRSAMR